MKHFLSIICIFLALSDFSQDIFLKSHTMTSAKPQDVLFAAPAMSEKDYKDIFYQPAEIDYFKEVSDITDLEDALTFKSGNLLEVFKFLCFGFGTEYHWRILIKPYFSMDPENKNPKASLIYAEFSF